MEEEPVTDVTSGGSSFGHQQRVEEFVVNGKLSLDLRTASGDITVNPSADGRCVVRMIAQGADAERRLSEVEVSFDSDSQALRVATMPNSSLRSGRRLFGTWRDVDLVVLVPLGTALSAKTASGDVGATVELVRATVSSASGDIRLATVTERARANTASGDVTMDTVHGAGTVRSASGDIEISNASGEVDVRTVSGDVSVGVDGSLAASVKSISGNVVVRVAKGLVVEVNATTLSGNLASEIDLDQGSSNDPVSNGQRVSVRISTVSGNAQIERK